MAISALRKESGILEPTKWYSESSCVEKCFCGAAEIWCHKFGLTEEEKGRANFFVDNMSLHVNTTLIITHHVVDSQAPSVSSHQ